MARFEAARTNEVLLPEWVREPDTLYPVPYQSRGTEEFAGYSTQDNQRFPTSSIRDRGQQADEELSDADRQADQLSKEWFDTILARNAAQWQAIEARAKTAIKNIRGFDAYMATASSPGSPSKKKARVSPATRLSVGKRKAESSAGSPPKKRRIFEEPLRRSSRSKKQITTDAAISVKKQDVTPKSMTVDKAAKMESPIIKSKSSLAIAPRPRRNVPRRTATITKSPSASTSPQTPSPLALVVTPSTLNHSTTDSSGLSGSSTAVSLARRGNSISTTSADTRVGPALTKNTNAKRKRVGDMDVAEVADPEELIKEPVALRRTSRVRIPRVNAAASPSKSTEVQGSPRKRRKATASGQLREKP